MSSLDELHRSLAEIRTGIADALSHAERAKSLLEESKRVIVDAQQHAEPWLPPQLPTALEQIATHSGNLAGVTDLLDGYEANL